MINFVQHLSDNHYDLIDMVAKHCFVSCFDGTDENPYLKRVLTHDGYCLTFNQLDFNDMFTDQVHDDFKSYKNDKKSNWNPTHGYVQQEDNYPYQLSNGMSKSFDALLLQDKNNKNKDCSSFRRGFDIYWHLPNEIVTDWHSTKNIWNLKKYNQITLKVKSFKMSPELQKYDVMHRQCYFENEKKLKYFKIYSEKNCMLECLSDQMIADCGCTRYYIPRNKTVPICTAKDLMCAWNVTGYFYENVDSHPCDCYSACNNIEYELYSVSEDDLDEDMKLGEYFDMDDLRSEEESERFTVISIKTVKGKIEERTSFSAYQMQQFISDFGGLLSLAMGCSILSIVEIIYNAFHVKHELEHDDEKDEHKEKF
ncbi:unnamed protein product [Chironomus riparius]|nr:unnamed protein product [Chironomus riparius]